MPTPGPRSFGYLTVLASPANVFTGALLLVDSRGRPVEFHCTAGVEITRAHEILYGAALRPYLVGERIGPALLAKAGCGLLALLVDDVHARSLAATAGYPIVLVREGPPGQAVQRRLFDPAVGSIAEAVGDWRDVGNRAVDLSLVAPERREEALTSLDELAASVDLAEPFERVREAIRETQQMGGESAGEMPDAA